MDGWISGSSQRAHESDVAHDGRMRIRKFETVLGWKLICAKPPVRPLREALPVAYPLSDVTSRSKKLVEPSGPTVLPTLVNLSACGKGLPSDLMVSGPTPARLEKASIE